MRRLQIPALLLALLLALPACGGKESAVLDSSPANTGEGDGVLYEFDGLQVLFPSQYWDQLIVDGSARFESAAGERFLLSVYEKASVEAAEADYGDGAGFGYLFGLAAVDQAGLEQLLCADYPGVDIFAADGENYYLYTYPTDVQFYRSGGELNPQSEDWGTWEALNQIGPAVREDFLTRNHLQSFTVQDFISQLTAEDGNHICVRYYPYYGQDGDTRFYYQLLLRQPARQGEGGIWAVDQWLDERGNQSLYFPDTGRPAAEYYAQLQEECDAGEHPEYLIPAGAAMAFAQDYFGREATGQGTVCEEAGSVDYDYMERNRLLEDMVMDLLFGGGVDEWALLDCVASAGADNWGVLGRYMYGSDWLEPLMTAVSDASVGENQQARDKAVLSFYLAAGETQTDFRPALSGILRAQRNMDPEAYQAALDSFSEEEREILLGAHFGSVSAPSSSGLPELAEAPDAPAY